MKKMSFALIILDIIEWYIGSFMHIASHYAFRRRHERPEDKTVQCTSIYNGFVWYIYIHSHTKHHPHSTLHIDRIKINIKPKINQMHVTKYTMCALCNYCGVRAPALILLGSICIMCGVCVTTYGNRRSKKCTRKKTMNVQTPAKRSHE